MPSAARRDGGARARRSGGSPRGAPPPLPPPELRRSASFGRRWPGERGPRRGTATCYKDRQGETGGAAAWEPVLGSLTETLHTRSCARGRLLPERLRHRQTTDTPSPPALIGVCPAAVALCGRRACQSAGSHSRGRGTVPCGAEGGGAAAADRRRGSSCTCRCCRFGLTRLGAEEPVPRISSGCALSSALGWGSRAGNRPPGKTPPCSARGSPTECGSGTRWPGGERRLRVEGDLGGAARQPPVCVERRQVLALQNLPAPAALRGWDGRSPALRGKAATARSAECGLGGCQGCLLPCEEGALASGSFGDKRQGGMGPLLGFPSNAWAAWQPWEGGGREALGRERGGWVRMSNCLLGASGPQSMFRAGAAVLPGLLGWAAPHLTRNRPNMEYVPPKWEWGCAPSQLQWLADSSAFNRDLQSGCVELKQCRQIGQLSSRVAETTLEKSSCFTVEKDLECF
ncbi:uncharacterized protein LOC135185522 [Pogoniulus pusillus]|uniref:uncharacterized protein LOC135185522 n=1 Tax=Pogoniulus pusillus TaxID=488313 RepID=UPI0030B936CA